MSPGRPTVRTALHRRAWFRAAVMVVLVYAVWCGLLLVKQRELIFPGAYNRNSRAVTTPDSSVITIEGVPVWSAGPRLVAGSGATAAPPPGVAGVALLFHGNDETALNAIRASPEVELLVRAGWSVLALEYPGFGGRPGKPSEATIAREGAAVTRWVRANAPRLPLVSIGYSLGGGVAASVARLEPPDGLILRNTFTSIADFAWGYGVPPALVLHPFDTRGFLKATTIPTLIVHAAQDQIVPVSHGRALAKAAPHATYAELDGDHFGFTDENVYLRAVMMFLGTHFPPRVGDEGTIDPREGGQGASPVPAPTPPPAPVPATVPAP